MKKYKVLATPRSFAATDPAPVQLLEENDCEVIRLPTNGHTLEEDLAVFLPEADAIIAGLETIFMGLGALIGKIGRAHV